MGFRFRKKIRITPGLSLNVGKKGITSTSLKMGNLTTNINGKGTKHTFGLPGSGLSYETKRRKGKPVSILWIVAFAFVVYYIATHHA
ncbi:DUF4236 domain-containing protein [Leclercia adecarboxylata]|jgi:hypothetical protein|uniref:DUF4236 domain-containing protein n=1 Tax=Leclercia adecarboxylata TaxID=83655 RepID=UPI00294A0142|nr:DUF4236 domain-containing protein [Leclercia adecarboxylata]MDV5238145.1 DUF4236 domain-containing protein [Leclercia adecarboxylata]MDV5279008.1 DUF4236 domain-containing protein [Leclercia adecarboxylata]MDV5462732.1 DUF4236 domain-containing protein [Leclercia adecarboxylata]MDV5502120.1 DUF4236 domain-containing protein [Leclercia adecarboxylata]MDV5534446.1 DUF4236 domain-containing protein [Leclercia adecarboxylata]